MQMYEAPERCWKIYVHGPKEIDKTSFLGELNVYLGLLPFLILSFSVNVILSGEVMEQMNLLLTLVNKNGR